MTDQTEPAVAQPILTVQLRKFIDLPLGTRFRYQEWPDERIVIERHGCGLVADGDLSVVPAALQGIYSAAESEQACRELEVIVVSDLHASLSAPFATEAGSIKADPQFHRLLEDCVCEGRLIGPGQPITPYFDATQSLIAYIDSLIQSAAPKAAEGWISVADRMPELHVAVALLNDDRWMNTGGDFDINWCGAGWLCKHNSEYWSVIGETCGMTLDSVTHWMPLPEAPALTGQKGGEPV